MLTVDEWPEVTELRTSDPSDPSDPSESATVLHFGEERRTWRQFYTLSTWPRCPEVATVAQFDAPETPARAVWKRAPRTATEHILSNSRSKVVQGLHLRSTICVSYTRKRGDLRDESVPQHDLHLVSWESAEDGSAEI